MEARENPFQANTTFSKPNSYNMSSEAMNQHTYTNEQLKQLRKKPLKAVNYLEKALFGKRIQGMKQRQVQVQVDIFTMENNFLILLSPPGYLPYTCSGDPLAEVNPLCHSCLTYDVSPEFYKFSLQHDTGLKGLPGVVALEGSWHMYPYSKFVGSVDSVYHPYFAMSKLTNSWKASANTDLQGVAYSLENGVFKIWFHEENPSALKKAEKEKEDELSKLNTLHRFLVNFKAWNADELKHEKIVEIGKHLQNTRFLNHGDSFLNSEGKKKYDDHCKEINEKVKGLQVKRSTISEACWEERFDELVTFLSAFKKQLRDWMASKYLSTHVINSLQQQIKDVKKEIENLKSCKPLLQFAKKEIEELEKCKTIVKEMEIANENMEEEVVKGCQTLLKEVGTVEEKVEKDRCLPFMQKVEIVKKKMVELKTSHHDMASHIRDMFKELGCPSSAYASSMQIESVRRSVSKNERDWLFNRILVKQIGLLLDQLKRVDIDFERPGHFFDKAANFLKKKYEWISSHCNHNTAFDPVKFIESHAIPSRSSSPNGYEELLFCIANSNNRIPQGDHESYPYVSEEKEVLKPFYDFLQHTYQNSKIKSSFQFYDEMLKLSHQLERVLDPKGQVYKRFIAEGNVEWEFTKNSKSSILMYRDYVHIKVSSPYVK